MRTYCVYIMASESGVLYVGVTNNLERRAAQHQDGHIAGFTERYNVHKLVYYEVFSDVRVAIAREKQIKGWLRKRKIALIESMNPSWNDLTVEMAKARAASRQGNPQPVILSAAKNLSDGLSTGAGADASTSTDSGPDPGADTKRTT
ncbi:MAG: GIY-YIG nuclease family protein [Candidatus Acidiferrales bacterium]